MAKKNPRKTETAQMWTVLNDNRNSLSKLFVHQHEPFVLYAGGRRGAACAAFSAISGVSGIEGNIDHIMSIQMEYGRQGEWDQLTQRLEESGLIEQELIDKLK